MNLRLTVMAVDFGTGGVLATQKGLLCVYMHFLTKKNEIKKLLHTYHCNILDYLHAVI